MTLASYASYSGLGLVQAAVVLLPRAPQPRWLAALRRRWLLVIGPAAALTAATFIPSVASAFASGLSTLALIAVPLLAAVGIAWGMRLHHLVLVPIVPVLFAVAWADPRGPVANR